jgi:type IV pilus assembly protein PilP
MLCRMGHLFLLPLVVVSLLLGLSGCGEGEHSDLKQFVENSGKDMRGNVRPLPEVKPFQHFVYDAFDLPDPFKPKKLEPVKGGGGNRPDLNRRKEALESFPLESLKMVGVLQQGGVSYGLIKSPDNALHRVKAGNYMGQNFGKIADITESEISLKEIIQDSLGDWAERVSTLNLDDPEQRK